MANDPRDLDGKRLQKAMHQLGRNAPLRKELTELLIRAEGSLEHRGSIRDDITGPIVDALHDDNDTYEKALADGTKLRFLFRTKIARDFLMASESSPTHVWEPQTTKMLMVLSGAIRGDVLVGGAYFGDQAILVARNVRQRAVRVHCFEPNLQQAAMLEQNIKLNGLENVCVNRMGLWSESSVRLKLDGFDSFANAVAITDDEDGFETISIDDYRGQCGIDVGLIQLDIEGAELKALQGAVKTIVQNKPHIVFEVHRDYVDWSAGLQSTDICKLLISNKYSVYAVRDFNTHRDMPGKPVELIPLDKVYLEGPPNGFNMVATQDPSIFRTPHFKFVEGVSPKLLLHKTADLHHPTDGL